MGGNMKFTDFGVSENLHNGAAKGRLQAEFATKAADYHLLGRMLYRLLLAKEDRFVSGRIDVNAAQNDLKNLRHVSPKLIEFIIQLLNLKRNSTDDILKNVIDKWHQLRKLINPKVL